MAYVFKQLSSGDLIETAKLEASDKYSGGFGLSVSVSGKNILVGSPDDDYYVGSPDDDYYSASPDDDYDVESSDDDYDELE